MSLDPSTTSVEDQADAEMPDSTHFGAQGLASGQQASNAAFQTPGSAARENEEMATAEYDPFEFVPAARLHRMQLLLAGGEPSAPVLLLVGFYSHDLIACYESDGIEVIACDYRAPEGPSMFYRGDVRDIIFARWWCGVVACPPCKNIAWSSASTFAEKRDDGRQWYGLSFAVFIWCAPADAVFMETARSELARHFMKPSQLFHPKDFKGGNGECKTTMAWIRGWPGLELDGDGIGSWQRVHETRLADANRTEIEKARWSTGLCNAVARACRPDTIIWQSAERRNAAPSFSATIRAVAQRYAGQGFPLPFDWDDSMARPAGGDEASRIALRDAAEPKVLPRWASDHRTERLASLKRHIAAALGLSSPLRALNTNTSSLQLAATRHSSRRLACSSPGPDARALNFRGGGGRRIAEQRKAKQGGVQLQSRRTQRNAERQQHRSEACSASRRDA